MQDDTVDEEPSVLHLLEPGEAIRSQTRATDALLVVTDRRLLVAGSRRLALDIPLGGLRRIQYDVECARPATLVIVPEHPSDEPQVLAIPPEQYPNAAEVLVHLGEYLSRPR